MTGGVSEFCGIFVYSCFGESSSYLYEHAHTQWSMLMLRVLLK